MKRLTLAFFLGAGLIHVESPSKEKTKKKEMFAHHNYRNICVRVDICVSFDHKSSDVAFVVLLLRATVNKLLTDASAVLCPVLHRARKRLGNPDTY